MIRISGWAGGFPIFSFRNFLCVFLLPAATRIPGSTLHTLLHRVSVLVRLANSLL